MCSWSVGCENSSEKRAGFMSHLETFSQHRSLLFAIAYRMLGTVTDA
jgi:RNA polymerase sigma-70 factor, ECF subfamily